MLDVEYRKALKQYAGLEKDKAEIKKAQKLANAELLKWWLRDGIVISRSDYLEAQKREDKPFTAFKGFAMFEKGIHYCGASAIHIRIPERFIVIMHLSWFRGTRLLSKVSDLYARYQQDTSLSFPVTFSAMITTPPRFNYNKDYQLPVLSSHAIVIYRDFLFKDPY